MRKLRRGISRLLLHVIRLLLVPLELLNARWYMAVYVRLLALYGLRLRGTPRYISSRARFDDFDLVSLGERVVISKFVILLTHDYSLTTALIAINEPPSSDISLKRGISIGRNVFLGMGAIILPGANIGDNVIVGAGSVVRGDVPADSIVVGNPARRVGAISDRADQWRESRAGANAVMDPADK